MVLVGCLISGLLIVTSWESLPTWLRALLPLLPAILLLTVGRALPKRARGDKT